MIVPEPLTGVTLIEACLARLRVVAATPASYPTFFLEEIGLEGGVAAVSAEAAANLGIAILHHFLFEELFDGEPEISVEQALALIGELLQSYDLQDDAPTVEDLDQDSDDYDPGRIHGPLEEIAGRILAAEGSDWFGQGGREQLMDALQLYTKSISGQLRLQG